jgi:hypothetical protein
MTARAAIARENAGGMVLVEHAITDRGPGEILVQAAMASRSPSGTRGD